MHTIAKMAIITSRDGKTQALEKRVSYKISKDTISINQFFQRINRSENVIVALASLVTDRHFCFFQASPLHPYVVCWVDSNLGPERLFFAGISQSNYRYDTPFVFPFSQREKCGMRRVGICVFPIFLGVLRSVCRLSWQFSARVRNVAQVRDAW